MKREQFSNALALDLESAVIGALEGVPENGIERLSPAENILESLQSAPDTGAAGLVGNIGDFVSLFHAAAEQQVSAYDAVGARIDRLEDDRTVGELRQVMCELHGALSELVSETAKSIVRIEDRIVSVAETVAALEAGMESSNSAFRHLSVSAHEKIAGLDEQLNSTLQRVEQGEKSAAELNAANTEVSAAIASLSEKIDLLGGRLSEEQTETRQLGEHLRLAERQIANFPEVEARVIALESHGSELRHFIKSLSQKHDVLRGQFAEEQKESDQVAEQLRQAERQIAKLPEVEARVRAAESHGSELRQLVHSLSQKHDFLRDKIASDQKETGQLVEHLRLAGRHLANFSNFDTRVRALESQEPDLRQVEKSLREIQGLNEQISADVCTLGEGLRSLHGEVESVNARHGHLKARLEQAEIGINDSLEQSQSLARLHARLAETYSAR